MNSLYSLNIDHLFNTVHGFKLINEAVVSLIKDWMDLF